MKASALYRADLWRAGLVAARMLPRPVLQKVATTLAGAYHGRNETRREIVIENLLPPLAFDRPAAEKACRALYRQFGLKLADLWRYEAGCRMDRATFGPEHWERFETARSRGRGLLLLTPHMGNWEFGAPYLRGRGGSARGRAAASASAYWQLGVRRAVSARTRNFAGGDHASGAAGFIDRPAAGFPRPLGHRDNRDRRKSVCVCRSHSPPGSGSDRCVIGRSATNALSRDSQVVWPPVLGVDRSGGAGSRDRMRAAAGVHASPRQRVFRRSFYLRSSRPSDP